MTAKAQAVCAKVRKPPEGVTSKLREMFPSSGGMVPQKRPSSVFDPLNECVAESQKRKKSGNYSEAETTECYKGRQERNSMMLIASTMSQHVNTTSEGLNHTCLSAPTKF